MRPWIIVLGLYLMGLAAEGQKIYPKKLIQFGWDYPTITFLKENPEKMQELPFDGVAFSFDFRIYDLFDSTLYPLSVFQFDDLGKIQWKKFTHNFIRVRAQSLDGPNWLNDRAWDHITINLRNISKAMQLSGARGLFFDAEYYYHNLPDKNPWVYNSTLYKGLSYEQVGAIVKNRGKQFINAIATHKQDPEIFSLWMLSLVTLQARLKPLSQTDMALYPFFVEGMMEGKNEKVKFIDGNELGYSYQSIYQYVFSGNEIRSWGMNFMPTGLKSTYGQMATAQPIFYDLIYGTFPHYETNLTRQQKDNWMSTSLYYAFKTSDEYVWFYNSHLDWWRKGNDSLSNLIRQTRTRLNNEFTSRTRRIQGSSHTFNFVEARLQPPSNYVYNYDRVSKRLTISFAEEMNRLVIFENSRILYDIDKPPANLNLTLSGFSSKGNLILAGSNKNNVFSFAFLN